MKNFKSFVAEAGPNLKPKAKGEADFVNAHKVEISDPEDQGTEGSAKVSTKEGSGKRKADKLDNKQAMGEDVDLDEELTAAQIEKHKQLASKHRALAKSSGGDKRVAHQRAANLHAGAVKNSWYKKGSSDAHSASKKLGVSEEFELTEEEILKLDEAETPFTPDKPKKSPSAVAGKYGQGPSTAKHLAKQGMQKTLRQMKKSKEMKEEESVEEKYVNPGLEKLAAKKKTLRQVKEADFTKQQTKMAHTIGKEFEKKGVGDETRGGPYAVASAMVKDRPEAAKKAYKTIQSKMKEETDAELLFKLYNDLNEENQEFFMHQLEEDADSLLEFARMMEEE
jgi:predicted house-cleaning noncanonical NTP pyrophosphatase (MazG superfamily)